MIPKNLSDVINATGAMTPGVPHVSLTIKPKDAPMAYDDSGYLKEARDRYLISKYLKFLPDAEAARGRSKDRSTKVGAVVIDDDFNVRISGYNGMPRRYPNYPPEFQVYNVLSTAGASILGFGYLLQHALIGWGLFLALMVLHLLEIRKAKSVGHGKGLTDQRSWLKNMLFGFTWWLPLERGIFEK